MEVLTARREPLERIAKIRLADGGLSDPRQAEQVAGCSPNARVLGHELGLLSGAGALCVVDERLSAG